MTIDNNPLPQTPPTYVPSTDGIFFKNHELRFVWSIPFFIVFFIAVVAGVGFLISIARHGHLSHASQHGIASPSAIVGEGLLAFAMLAATWLISLFEQRLVSVYGMGGSGKFRLFASGTITGIICLGALVLTLVHLNLLTLTHTTSAIAPILKYGSIWAAFFIAVAVFEENMTRGYLQRTVTRGFAMLYKRYLPRQNSLALAFWSSALLFSAGFGLIHLSNKGESPIGIFSAALIGLVFCFSLWRTGSLWWALGFHASWDWAQSYVFGVADSGTMIRDHIYAAQPQGNPIFSGGATGPEGSIYVFAACLLAFLFILPLRKQTVYPDLTEELSNTPDALDFESSTNSSFRPEA